MRKLLPVVIIGILVLSGLGASAVIIEKDNTININYNKSERATHTVLGEYGTATWCGYCKYAHGALKELYAEGQLDFYYVTLVCDKNNDAYQRAKNGFNLYGYPTVWWDGGHRVNVGAGSVPTAKTSYTSSINYCGIRTVKNVDITLDVTWQGGTKIKVECEVINNEPNTYNGHIRVYIVEKESSMGWTDTAGDLYTMAFLDWAFNKAISIPSGGTWSDSMTWNGQLNGFPSVTKSNMFVIAAVFNDEWHQGYSYPPSNNPFDAYYVDETVGVVAEKFNINLETPRNIALKKPLIDLLQINSNLLQLLQKIKLL
jgi:thiol-disulfide isomerase/thioredoxin